MAAPQKEGLDYFPFDVKLLKDTKLMLVRDVYGYVANDIYISLLTLLYSEKGYYIPYESRLDKIKCIRFIQNDLIGGKYSVPNTDLIARVIDEMVACELFSGDHYPKNITSKRSQTVYYTATAERKSVNIKNELWLVSLVEMQKLSAKHSYYLLNVSGTNNEDNRSNNEDNRSNNPQSKSNQSKSNQSNLLDSQTAEADENEAEINFYFENIIQKISELDERFFDYKQRLEDIAKQAIKIKTFNINKVDVSLPEFLKAFQYLFSDPNQVLKIFEIIDGKSSIKNKFLYTVSAIYNTVMKF